MLISKKYKKRVKCCINEVNLLLLLDIIVSFRKNISEKLNLAIFGIMFNFAILIAHFILDIHLKSFKIKN